MYKFVLNHLLLVSLMCSISAASDKIILKHNTGDNLKLCAKYRPCVRKCCPENHVLKNKVCTFSETHKFKVDVYKGLENTNNMGMTFNVIHNKTCGEGRGLKLSPKRLIQDVFYLQRNGSLYKPNDNITTWVPFPYYCLETFVLPAGDEFSALVCYVPNQLMDSADDYAVAGMIISMPFLLATFLVYALLPESNLHRRALMSYVLTLLLAYIILVGVQLSGEIPPLGCHLLGYSIVFFFTVSFFWMNVMCIDMWLTFRGMRGYGGRKKAERKRFIIYSIYAWGMPLLHVLMVFLLNTYGDESSPFHPALGAQRCFVGEGLPNFLYFYCLTMIIIIINIILFMLTGIKIYQVKKDTSMLKHSDSNKHSYEDDKQQFKLYVKLLFAMGINWVTEIISWAIAYFWQETPEALFYLTDFVNATYGVFIFFIFVFKRKIWKSLKKRYYICIGKPHLAQVMSTTRNRTSNYSTTATTDTGVNMTEMRNGKEEERALNRI